MVLKLIRGLQKKSQEFCDVWDAQAYSSISASKYSVSKGHSWTEKRRRQSSPILSSLSFSDLTTQVKGGYWCLIWPELQLYVLVTRCPCILPPHTHFLCRSWLCIIELKQWGVAKGQPWWLLWFCHPWAVASHESQFLQCKWQLPL